jgi:hypothetical protein
MKSSEGGGATNQKYQRKNMKEYTCGAKFAPFCRRARSFYMKLLPKEVLKKPLKGYTTKSLD